MIPLYAQLRAAREAAGLSQAELADRADTGQAALSRIEGGEQDPRLSTLARIAGALGCELEIRLAPRTKREV
jgi:transcriptional regulator with XRE-family HTH domain